MTRTTPTGVATASNAEERFQQQLREGLAAAAAEANVSAADVPSWRDDLDERVLVGDTLLGGKVGLMILGGSLAAIVAIVAGLTLFNP